MLRLHWKLAMLAAGLSATLAIGSSAVRADENAVKDAPPVLTKSASDRPACPDLPESIASFGAAVCGPWLYVYSGHVGTEHDHSRDNLSQKFSRLNLGKPTNWEALPMETPLQGLPLVTDGNVVYRVGGLSARNKQGEEEDLVSTDEFSRYDPASGKWARRTPLPEGRSSHDAIVVDHVLYVLGGWQLGKEKTWHDDALKIRLDDPQAQWEKLPAPPFHRRALAVAAHDQKLYAIGGMTQDSKPSSEVHVFDLKTNQWSQGPSLPGKPFDAFGCSAAVLPSGLYVSLMDGRMLKLSSDGTQWLDAGKLAKGRFFHRLLPVGSDAIVAVGGASRDGHISSVEWFVPQPVTNE